MQKNKDTKIALIALSAFILILGYIAFQFSVSDRLAGFSDDSPTYLIMAMVFSPFREETNNILNAYYNYHLPPAFPFVLSLFNGGNNIYVSHCVVLIQALLSCVLFFYLCKNILGTSKAFLALFLFVCMPTFWVQMLKIIPEYQYIFLSTGFLLLVHITNDNRHNNITISIFFGIILSLCILTRSIGISLAIAYTITTLIKCFKNRGKVVEVIGVLSGLAFPLMLWKIIQPEKSHSYVEDLFSFVYGDEPVTIFINTVSTNVVAMYKGIALNMSLLSSENDVFVTLLMTIIMVLALLGWLMRIKKVDGLYLSFYLSVLLVWPYPNEMNRFFFPVMPIIILYIFYAVHYLSCKYSYKKSPAIMCSIVFFFITSSSLTHIINRYKLGSNQYGKDLTNIVELYEIENDAEAITVSYIWNRNIENIRSLKDMFDKNDKVLTAKPHLFTYYTDVYAEKLPRILSKLPNESLIQKWIKYINNVNATHLLLMNIKLTSELNEIDVVPLISEFSETIINYGYIYNDKEQSTLAVLKIL